MLILQLYISHADVLLTLPQGDCIRHTRSRILLTVKVVLIRKWKWFTGWNGIVSFLPGLSGCQGDHAVNINVNSKGSIDNLHI